MSNMNKKTRDKLYPIIVSRDGEYCKCCGKLPNEANLILDHRDNDNTNNSHTNLQILCRSCNYIKNPRKESLDLCVKEKSSENDDESCLAKNKRTEPAFRAFILNEIDNDEVQSLKWDDIINMGAEKIGISQMTAERYLKKMTSKYGPLQLLSAYEHRIVLRRFRKPKESPQLFEW